MHEKSPVDNLKREFKQLATGDIMPPEVGDRLLFMSGRIRIMYDIPFQRFMLGSNSATLTPAGVGQFERQARYNGAYVFTNFGTQDDRIGLRESYVRSAPKYQLLNLVCEELGHSLAHITRTPLASMPDSPELLAPYKNREEVVSRTNALQPHAAPLYKDYPVASISSVSVLKAGWKNVFYDTQSGFEYPLSDNSQSDVEELRSAILQNLFMAFHSGHGLTHAEKIADGISTLSNQQDRFAKETGMRYSRVKAGLTILKRIFSAFPYDTDTLRSLFASLYDSTPNQFMQQWGVDEKTYQKAISDIKNEIIT